MSSDSSGSGETLDDFEVCMYDVLQIYTLGEYVCMLSIINMFESFGIWRYVRIWSESFGIL